jgi:hypothetical protein
LEVEIKSWPYAFLYGVQRLGFKREGAYPYLLENLGSRAAIEAHLEEMFGAKSTISP